MTSQSPLNMPKTKIVATLGPASSSETLIASLISSGMNVARLNASHGSHSSHLSLIQSLRGISTSLSLPSGVLLDLQGPRLRLGLVSKNVVLSEGRSFVLDSDESPGDHSRCGVSYSSVLAPSVSAGDRILIDDGRITLRVLRSTSSKIETQVESGGSLSSRKGLNFPDSFVDLPPITEKDVSDLAFALEHSVDFIALSFVGSADHVLSLRERMHALGKDIPIIAKIERKEAISHLNEIAKVADGLMVARGDLALEVGPSRVPLLQKEIISCANISGIPVVTATQMLDSMIQSRKPTRAETSDVANAVLDGTDAVMLSGETAIGKHPVESVREMRTITNEVESAFDQTLLRQQLHDHKRGTLTHAISGAAVHIAEEIDAAAIVAVTTSGRTARRVAQHRSRIPIVGATRRMESYSRLALSWGIRPLHIQDYATTDEMVENAIQATVAAGVVDYGDSVVITSGLPLGISGTTRMVQVRVVGES